MLLRMALVQTVRSSKRDPYPAYLAEHGSLKQGKLTTMELVRKDLYEPSTAPFPINI